MTDEPRIQLPDRLIDAVTFATNRNRNHTSQVSLLYLAPLLGVASLILRHGGDEEEAIAGVLLDAVAVDDRRDVAAVRARFGDTIVQILGACSAPHLSGVARSWSAERQSALDTLADADDSSARVLLAYELYTLRTILTDLAEEGPSNWDGLHAGRHERLWYYEALSEVVMCRQWPQRPSPLANEVSRAVAELRVAAHGPPPAHPRPSDWNASMSIEIGHPCGTRHPLFGKRCRRRTGHAGIHGYSPRPGDGTP